MTIRARMTISLSLLGVSLALLSGCSGGNKDEILIGHYASLTGSEATFGRSTDNGIILAVEEINAKGGVNGKKIRLITENDEGLAEKAGAVVTRLVTKDNVKAVLGEVGSKLSLAAAPICQQNGVPMISPSSTNVEVTKVGDKIFRVCFIDPFQGYAGAKFARETEGIKAKTAAVLFDQTTPYSVDLGKEFAANFEKMGGKILASKAYTKGDPDFGPPLRAIKSENPDVIYISGYYTDVGNIALQARKIGINQPLIGGDGWDSEKLTEIGGKDIEGCFYSNHYAANNPNEKNEIVLGFIERYEKRFKSKPDGLAALGYDAANILFKAMEQAPSLDGDALAKAIAATKDFGGVTGKITIDQDRNAVKPAIIVEVKDGKPIYKATINPE